MMTICLEPDAFTMHTHEGWHITFHDGMLQVTGSSVWDLTQSVQVAAWTYLQHELGSGFTRRLHEAAVATSLLSCTCLPVNLPVLFCNSCHRSFRVASQSAVAVSALS